MPNTPHQLAEEFPEHLATIRHLRAVDGHFHRICEEYQAVNLAIHRAEADIEPVADLSMIDMREARMRLKDEIYGMLTQPEKVAQDP
ncbi:YdcH family protein [Shinella sumterensis]|uniref:DUF465 domain-containing protein n=1 Tax=Shinella sumterensis TaxID=1967501 RepID=A0AA50H6L1_9HYPH|nr:DUF465 domain-containing protein [Shinella sumterensis]WLR98568.1 DUF465 domain-containing protein [Shinella sumterensis]